MSNKKIIVEYLYLDLNTCERCIGTDKILDDVMQVLKPGGMFIASGIYENREEQVVGALREAGFEEIARLREERWTALIVRKP